MKIFIDCMERYLIVSLGSIGSRHLRNLRQICPQAQIGVLRQITPTINTEPPEGVDLQFKSLQQALDFCPVAAIVAGPATTHLTVARRLAESGVHLLVEKPLADRLEGLKDLIAICRHHRLILMTGYNLRFLPSLRRVKELLDQGVIGKVLSIQAEVGQYLPDWRPGSDYRQGITAKSELGGGVLLELSHELDYLYWLFGLPVRVTAKGGRYSDLEIDVEDIVELIMEYEWPPRLVSAHLDMVQRSPRRSCRFIGSEGTLVWDGIADQLKLYQADLMEWQSLMAPTSIDRNQMYLDELGHFLACVRGQEKPLIDGIDGYNVLSLVTAVRKSMAQNIDIEVRGYEP